MVVSRGMSWLLVFILELVSGSAGLNFSVIPQNVTIGIGKSATFYCGVSTSDLTEKTLSFIVQSPATNYSLTCPGQPSNNPVMSLNGRCETKSTETIAAWEINNAIAEVNGTIFRCHSDGLSDKIAYLWVDGNSSYYAMLFGCVMGGFFGILIIFGVSYVFLKRSERLQNCFKGPDEEDEMTEIENMKGY